MAVMENIMFLRQQQQQKQQQQQQQQQQLYELLPLPLPDGCTFHEAVKTYLRLCRHCSIVLSRRCLV
jgi:hypothetical protein